MARRVREDLIRHRDPRPPTPPGAKVFHMPTNLRMYTFALMELGLLNFAALSEMPYDRILGDLLLIIAFLIPGLLWVYEGKRRAHSVTVSESGLEFDYRFSKPLAVSWDQIVYLQMVYLGGEGAKRGIGWMRASNMRTPTNLPSEAAKLAIAFYTSKTGKAPPSVDVNKS